jgi:hypothetical protein
MQTESTATVLTVPHYNVDAFRARIAKFSRWCEREGMPGPRVTESPATIQRPYFERDKWGDRVQVGTYPVPACRFEVATDLLRLPGDWALAAVVTPTDGGLVTTHAPGAPVVPADVIGDGMRCDHCECRRRRNETFAVVDGAGAFRMVGRQCVRAYLGVDPARWAAYLSGYAACLDGDVALVDDDREEGGEPCGYGRMRVDADVHRVLAAALFTVKARGAYVKADPEGKRPTPSTRSEVAELLDPYPVISALRKCRTSEAARALAALFARLEAFEADAATHAQALDARRWAANLPSGSTCDADMVSIARAGHVGPRSMGLTCWMAAAYLKSVGELGERERPMRTDAHVAAVGERVDLTGCTLVHRSTHESHYGTSTLLVGYTADGRRFKCWYSGAGDIPAVGERFDVRATVKACEADDRDGTKVTALTRAKFTNIVDPAAPSGVVEVAA